MKRLTRSVAALGALLAFGHGSPALAADAATVAAATKEGEVVWCTTLVVDQAARPIQEAFEKKYPGIKVRMLRSQGPETVARLLAEVRAGKVETDVIDATLSGVVGIPAEVMQRLPAAVVGVVANNDRIPGDRWVPINQYYSCIAINTDMVKGADVPKSFEDLLDPKWKGKLVWHSTPDLSGPPGFIGMILTTMGKDKGMAYLKRLADQKITILPTSQRGVMDQVIAGAYPIQIMAVNQRVRGWRAAAEGLQYLLCGTGALALSAGPVMGFVKTDPALEDCDVQYHATPMSFESPETRKLDTYPAITISSIAVRPSNRGSIHIVDRAGAEPPAIRFNAFAHEADVRTIARGLQIVRRIVAAPAWARYQPEEQGPSRALQTEDELCGYIRERGNAAMHPVGTCRMGSANDPMAVVDSSLRVRGIDGLRVVDASIMPTLTSGNTMAPSLMIGAKAADLIAPAA